MYPPEIVMPMKHDITSAGVKELLTPEDVDAAITAKGTALVFINSVCGCAAGNARPSIKMALKHSKLPTRMTTVFAGFDVAAVAQARKYMAPYPPSSPSIALFKDGNLVHFIERHHIEGRTPEMIVENLTGAFDEFC
ncbi:MAG: BrxA/BrxB family bacilliredoxin [Flavobacteriales bacterium]|jgi:putative YphP/YqiW family bacilliredoxin|nr:BrxA/BrxB family bacilliredoxin [Flavobacteriales bacterium]